MTVSPEEAARLAAERERGQRNAMLREWYTAPTAEEMCKIKTLKLDDSTFLDKTQRLIELGPIVGSSFEGRVLRWIEIEVYGARCEYERDPRYWDAAFRATVENEGREKAVEATHVPRGRGQLVEACLCCLRASCAVCVSHAVV